MIPVRAEREAKASEGGACAHPGCTEPAMYWRCCATHAAPIAETRRIERPRLVSQPLPPGARREGSHVYARGSGHGLPIDAAEGLLQEVEREARDVLAVVEWLRWERAVRAQGGES